MRLPAGTALLVAVALVLSTPITAQKATRRPLLAADIDDIATLLRLEDTRQFDLAVLSRLVGSGGSGHPEVKRRAIISIGRIANEQGRALLTSLHGETDPVMLGALAFATGQLKDPGAVAWLGDILSNAKTPPAAAKEAAQALGKIANPEARIALAAYLTKAIATPATTPVIGEALLSLGRFTTKEDLTPIVRWTSARDPEIRWRAAWSLFRPKDPAAVPHLLRLSADASPDVRFWALRGLAPAQVDQSGVSRADASTRLRQALNDPDRRVRTEAIRALIAYDDDASFEAVVTTLSASDTWLSVSASEAWLATSAAEQLAKSPARAARVIAAFTDLSAPSKPLTLRLSALTPLVTLAPDTARTLANALAKSASVVAQQAAATAVRQLDAAAARAAQAASGVAATPPAGRGGAGRGNGAARPALVARPDAEYRALVTQWIVPDYNGAPRPHVLLTTPRGQIDVELFPGDAPFGVEYLIKVVESGEIVNTEFGRVVPNFVDQQRAIRNEGSLRDEVNQYGLRRGTLSWASSGLDTGRPGYTLGSTPQPHNEGNFTALGRVVKGIEVVDRIELGDKITRASIPKR